MEKQQCRGIIVSLLCLVLLLCSGCRMRVVEGPEADLFLPLDGYTETESEISPSQPPEEEDEDQTDNDESDTEPSASPSPIPSPTAVPSQSPAPSSRPNPENKKANPNSTVQTVEKDKKGEIEKKEQTVTVSLDPNSGTCSKESLKVSPGSPYGKLPDAKRKGFQFVGWFFSKEDGIRVTEDTIVTISEDHTLYAHWTQSERITLTLDPQGGRLLKSEEKLELYTGETYGYLPIPRRPGYNFDGWNTAPENGIKVTESSIFDGTEDLTLYAQWIYDPFAYWTFVLQNTSETVYFCQLKSGYLEYDQDHVTPGYSSLLASTAVQNVAQNRGGGTVDDDWVTEKNPNILIKCVSAGTDLNKAAGDLRKRLPDRPVYVVPAAAENGTPEEQLYFKLYFAKLVYGEWFEEVDMSVVSRELGVSGSVLVME